MPHSEQDGLKLHYERAGGGGPELVFVHGCCCDRTFFQPQFDYFAQSCSVTTLDRRGCGESGRPPDGYDIPTLADDVVGLCHGLGITKPVIAMIERFLALYFVP